MKTATLLTDISSWHAALDSVQTNIFIADMGFNLVYMNLKAEKTLKNIEKEIFEIFGVRVDNFIGKSIHRFHSNPKKVEKILRNPQALPHEARFDFGAIRLKTVVNGITTMEGEIIGYIVNWEDKSKKVRQIEEMADLFKEFQLIEEGYAGK